MLANFVVATGLSPSDVRAMQLISLDGRAGNFQSARSDGRSDERTLATREWFYLHGSNVCPGCLRERAGAYRMRWKLPWSFGCLRHGRMLLSRCSACQQTLVPAPRDRNPPYIAHPVQPGHCLCRPARPTAKGRAARPCGHDLASERALAMPARVLRAQQLIDGALDHDEARVAGAHVSCGEYLAHARALAALVLRFAQPGDLGRLSRRLVDAFDDFVVERERRLVTKHPLRARPAARFYTATPRSPELMAAIAPLVTDVLAAHDRDEMRARLSGLSERLEVGRSSSATLAGRFALTPLLADAITQPDRSRLLWASASTPPPERGGGDCGAKHGRFSSATCSRRSSRCRHERSCRCC